MTDANLLLGRLVPAYFPHIFGKSEKEPLDVEASRTLFEDLARVINSESLESEKKGLDEIVYGYANLVSDMIDRNQADRTLDLSKW